MKKVADWQNPKVIGINKNAAHAESPSFESFDELSNYYKTSLSNEQSLEPFVWPNLMDLNGLWKFKLSMDVETRPEGFYQKEFSCDAWDDIKVPGVWQLQGYHEIDKPYYLAFDYPPAVSKKKIPYIHDELNSVGSYRRIVTIAQEYLENGQRAFIHFGAVKSAFYLWVNGEKVGYSQGSMTPSEFDITDLLVVGENIIATEVYRYSDGTYLEDQDMWFLSGMYRDVYIYFEPSTYIKDYFIKTSRTEDGQWLLSAELYISNTKTKALPTKVEILFDGKVVSEGRIVIDLINTEKVYLEALIEDPKLWSAEEPNLYPIIMVIKSPTDVVYQIKQQLVGFREITIDEGVFKLNGVNIKLHGINRHEFHSDFGYATPKETILNDLLEMKRLNINAIRTSHYPNSPYFYNLCDRLGFYVMDEADIETHGLRHKGVPGDNTLWTEAVVDRIERMVLRDRNHTCVIMWSLGNEAGFGYNFYEMKKAAKTLDATRFIHYEGDKWLKVSDVFSRMYATPEYVRKTGNNEDIKNSFWKVILNRFGQDNKSFKKEDYVDKPIMYCEFAHAMENSLGNLKEHVEAWYDYPKWLGGFIWDYVDQSIHMNIDGTDQWLYGGDFGEDVSHRYYNANGIVAGNRQLHPSAYEVKKVYQYIKIEEVDIEKGDIQISNRFCFKNLNEFMWAYELLEDGAVTQKGVLENIDIKAKETKLIHVPFDSFHKELGALYHLNVYMILKEDTAYEKAGYIQGMEQVGFLVKGSKENNCVEDYVINVADKLLTIELKSSEFSATVSKSTGDITSLRVKDHEILRKAIRLNLWRAETDNDRGLSNFNPKLRKFVMDMTYKKANSNYKAQKYEINDMHSSVQILIQRKVKGFKGFVETEYIFDGEGNVEIKVKGLPKKEIVRFGTTLGISEDWSSFMYFGKGPHENYIDRCSGAHMGIFDSTIKDFGHWYMRPQENGNRQNVRWFIAENTDQIGMLIEDTSGNGVNISAWPYTQEELDSKEHIHELEEADYIILNVDGMQKGVGGDYPGMLSLMDKYKIRAKEVLEYSFKIQRV